MRFIALLLMICAFAKAEELTYEQALQNLAVASRQVRATADDHAILSKSVKKLADLLEKIAEKESKNEADK